MEIIRLELSMILFRGYTDMKLHENEFSEIITKTIEESSLSPYYKTRAKSYFRKHKVSGNIINIVAKHWYVEYIKKGDKRKDLCELYHLDLDNFGLSVLQGYTREFTAKVI